jgi:hypothetical protein
MNPYSGLVDVFEQKGLLQKDGNRLKYVLADGTELKQYRKEWEHNTNACLDTVMVEFAANPSSIITIEDTLEEIEEYVE